MIAFTAPSAWRQRLSSRNGAWPAGPRDSEEKITTAQDHRGLLVPVSNPEGVAPLIAIAIAASEPDDPPPRVIALVRRSGAAESAQAPPATPALSAAIEYARAHGVSIDAQAVWSDTPALDIVAAAQQARAAWVLLGYHRGTSGGNTMGGVVSEVFARAKSLPINVAAFIQGTDRPFERVFAATDASPDGRAALALASRIARRNKCKLRALLVSNSVAHLHADLPDTELVEMLRAARAGVGRLFHSDVLTQRSLNQLFKQTPGRLLVVGKKFADEVGLPLDEVPDGDRCVIVVDGADPGPHRGSR